ncbi:beta-ketoacyl synthase N-terminal-like domain-containing protein [Kitasatospora sp. NPDC058063]|uniref:beta-ketoacyl synthase N-terminal-like domain-containing protein n=1 Tax=Kitasatospora sp. NPDC058063 TaxID=3346321 RepID=UPI0036DD8FEB
MAAVAEVLGRPVDPLTPFYELGLTTVTLARVRTLLERTLGAPVPASALYEHPTAAALATHLAGEGATHLSGDAGAPTAEPAVPDQRIAVIGMAAHFPGAEDLDAFWANLRAGRDSTRRFSAAELDRAGVPRARHQDPAFRSAAGVLTGLDEAAPEFFGISPMEAELTAPANLLFLETCYRALEHGGHAGPERDGRIGVYAGSGMQLYGHQDGPAPRQGDFLAAKVAYRLGLTGPAVNVQTACSTSLVAVHLAVQALLTGDADLALAGAAAVRTPQEAGYLHFPGSILSEQGRCRPFDAAADGTVGGNGVAAVLLKRLDRALADGDTVHAIILGSAVNNDGRGKAGFAAPSAAGQAEVVRQALRRAAVAPDTISYLEAHGTGTPVGDPIELRALAQVFGTERRESVPLAVGSVKGNVGHLDTCAGMAGLLKTVLMLKHGTLVPTANLAVPSPELGLADGPFHFPDGTTAWPAGPGPRRAGVSALGVGGTNAHVVLEEPPAPTTDPQAARTVALPVSAGDPDALRELCDALADRLTADPAVRPVDAAATLALGRPRLPFRRTVTGRTAEDLAAALRGRVGEEQASEPPTPAFVADRTAGPGGAADRARCSGSWPRWTACWTRP